MARPAWKQARFTRLRTDPAKVTSRVTVRMRKIIPGWLRTSGKSSGANWKRKGLSKHASTQVRLQMICLKIEVIQCNR